MMKVPNVILRTSLILLVLSSLLSSLVEAEPAKVQQDGRCQLATLIPFTDLRDGPPGPAATEGVEYYGYGQWSSAEALGKASFSLMAAAQMAKDHFNDRNPTVVPALADLGSCNVFFPENWIIDSGYSRSKTVDALINIERNSTDPANSICAVIGPIEPRACEGTGVLTENLRIPQIAYATIDRRLDRSQDFPTFARNIPTAVDYADTISTLVQRDVWKRDYLGVIYDQSDYGEQFEDPLEDAEDTLEYVTITEHVEEDNPETWDESFGEAEGEGYHTIFFATDRPSMLDKIAVVADNKGLVGENFLWIMTGDILPPEIFASARFEVDSPADRLLRGAYLVTNYDPFIYQPTNDPFLEAWKSNGDDMLDRLKALHPLSPNDPGYYIGEPGYFESTTPAEYASFLYDAIITAGISACKSQQSGDSHLSEIFKSDFVGASGRVVYKEGTNSRDRVGTKFGVYNVQPGEIDEETNTRGYNRYLTAIFDGAEDAWTLVTDPLYFDGTNNEPMPVRRTEDFNYLSSGFRTLGFVLMGVSLANILICAMWILLHSKERLITAAQPQFLYLICFGAAVQAISLLFHSFDESYDWSDSQLDFACSAFPWFFVMGYLIQYCAVFSKLWRLSKLLSLRRRAVGIQQVLLPFSLIITCSVTVLAVWQGMDPMVWVRENLSDDAEDPWVSFGQCSSPEIGVVPFVVPLALLFGIIIAMTLAISWKMRDVQSDLSEANWIFIAIFSHLQIWVIGVPVYLILDGVSRDATYLITVALIFIFSNTMVCFMMWPKIVAKHFGKGEGKRQGRITVQPGSATTRVSGLNIDSGVTGGSGLTSGFPSSGGGDGQYSSAATYDNDKLKILQLEAKIEDLKSKLGGSEQLAAEGEGPKKMEEIAEE